MTGESFVFHLLHVNGKKAGRRVQVDNHQENSVNHDKNGISGHDVLNGDRKSTRLNSSHP